MSSRRERCMGFNYTHRATAARTSYWLEIFALHSTTLEDRKSCEHKFGKGQNQVLNADFANLYSPYVKHNKFYALAVGCRTTIPYMIMLEM